MNYDFCCNIEGMIVLQMTCPLVILVTYLLFKFLLLFVEVLRGIALSELSDVKLKMKYDLLLLVV